MMKKFVFLIGKFLPFHYSIFFFIFQDEYCNLNQTFFYLTLKYIYMYYKFKDSLSFDNHENLNRSYLKIRSLEGPDGSNIGSKSLGLRAIKVLLYLQRKKFNFEIFAKKKLSLKYLQKTS